ncbi:unnamed protein product [Rotaria magnacalcarata]|uniref:Uncharacterized protein n=1 Tax=Rotaria magnacalcarata TaxID=392030 RepID=A0A815IK06_9BILA|nr:unnamed protein product [Rotaria magnacalcarata]CAF3990191.1 unnamed protein product [Rotaria magnacalcarata]
MIIGTNEKYFPNNYWNDCLDQISFFSRAKNATEILSDATQIVAYIFDNTLLDSGPLGINGSGVNYSYTYSGRVCLGLSLSTTASYAQVQGLVLLGTSGEAYSMAIWSNPIINTVGTIIHVSATVTGGIWSMPMLGFTNTGRIGVHGCSTGGSILLTEPIVASNVYTTADVAVIITFGSSVSSSGACSSGIINSEKYRGSLDEFRLFSRERFWSDVWDLANP